MTNKQSELKSCPFCGSDNVDDFLLSERDSGEKYFMVMCDNCSAFVKNNNNDDAKTHWNNRASSSPWIEIKSDNEFELGKEYLCFFPSRIDAEGRTINESILVQEFNKDRNNKFGLGTMHFVGLDKDTGKTYFGFGIYHDKPTHYMPIPEIK